MLTIQMCKQRILTVAGIVGGRALVRSSIPGLMAVLLLLSCLQQPGLAQSASSGAVSGTVTDPVNAVVVGAQVIATNLATGEKRTVNSGGAGVYLIPFLSPGTYSVEASAKGFKQANYPDVRVVITETVKLDIRLVVGAVQEVVTVESRGSQLQTESTNLGQVTSGEILNSLPLVTRNYTQIIALNPGVAAEASNAGSVGRGGGDIETPVVSHGVSAQDNNFQMNGVEINDLQSSGHFSGGIAIPNPDSIQEFKVQTGQYDASYGRNAGANVDVVTKGGSNAFHGTIFEYLRNEDLNANSFFFNQSGQPRGILRENQPGFTFGGPIKKDKLMFFTSYQATRQTNGIASQCSSTLVSPPLTNDRSAAALGAIFAGQPTFVQEVTGSPLGPTVASDGSNISPQALALLQMKLPNGQFLIPTPQTVDPSKPLAVQGTSTFSDPCSYNENQFITNADYLHDDHNTFSGKFFWANSNQNSTFPSPQLLDPTSPGFPTLINSGYRNLSLTYTHVFSPNMLNQAEVAFHRSTVALTQQEAFNYSQIGVNAPAFDNAMPAIDILGSMTLGGNGQSVDFAQNTFVYQDVLSYNWGRHAFRFGGGLTRAQDNETNFQFLGGMIFGTFSDFLLGQSAAQNGTPFSNVFESVDAPGLFARAWRVWDGDLFVQDDFKVNRRLTLNLGVRFERLGGIGDELGRNATFNFSLANPNPPAGGSLAGFTVPSNFNGPIPPGVTQIGNNLGINGDGQNTINPRFGFAWQLPYSQRFVLRGGWGVYHSRTTGQPTFQLLTNQPFAEVREPQATGNAGASFANPFAAAPALPSFTPYSPTTSQSVFTFAPDYRPAMIQQYSLNLQSELSRNTMLEVGFIGARGTHLLGDQDLNQALSASAANPIRGVTNNSFATVPLRVPIEGFGSFPGIAEFESEGASWYNALEASLKQRLSHGLQFQLSYTFSKDLATDLSTTTTPNGGNGLVGDQTDPLRRYGPDDFNRPHRFVASYLYQLPGPTNLTSAWGRLAGGWALSGASLFQSGHPLTITVSSPFNAFGILTDFPQLVPGCSVGVNAAVETKLNSFFNTNCFAPLPLVGPDPFTTGFGNAGVGIVKGPGQVNTDLAIIKKIAVRWPAESANVEFRTEFFNFFNHPQFSDPDTNLSSPTFGQILTTAVNPRVIQFALKYSF
ncbi:MAG TPA: carboxypeptidase regulatory-like domain-containing protein [Terriglobales bacterium]